jgi:hypothetical protein
MKRILLLTLLTVICHVVKAQVDTTGKLDSTGRSHVNFSVDGDTRNNFQKYSSLPHTSTMHHDDWFLQDGYMRYDVGGSGFGNSIFDTIGTATYKAQLQANQNINFVKRMKVAAFDVMPMWKTPLGPTHPDPALRGFDSSFWVDGIYFRDYAGSSGDITSFSGGKNGDDPNTWTAGNSVSSKSDIVDVYTHVRTSGINPIRDSVWFFAGVSTVATNGNRFFDIEVYRDDFTYNETTKQFTSSGTLSGHSPWTFNGTTGMVSQSGDIIISVAYQAGRAPEIDFRIFIAKSTYDSAVADKLNPATFKFVTSQFNLNTAGNGGYIQIAAKSGATTWGSGVANYLATNTEAQDTTLGPPWGTLNSSGSWSNSYDQLQFIEIALNFSRFGMNPFHYVTSFCRSPYSSIIVKSRASTSFTANLEDFVVPQPFSVKNLAPFTVTPDTVTCASPTGQLKINVAARNYYRWFNSNLDTLSKDSDTTTFRITQPGTYYVEGTNFKGCPTMGTRQTVVVSADTTAPTAAALLGHGEPFYFLNGVGGITGSSFGSSSLSYSWTGPAGAAGFPTTTEDPKLADAKENVVTGDYTLTVTQGRNGCSATSMINVNPIVLANYAIILQGKLVNGRTQLNWSTTDATQAASYIIERSSNGAQYAQLGHVAGAVGTKRYSFIDSEPVTGFVQYRIKSISGTASIYSNTIFLQANHEESIVMSRQPSANRVNIQLKKATDKDLLIKVMSLDGRVLLQQNYSALQARNMGTSINLSLPATSANLPVVVAVYQDAYLLEARKL